jgi:hypothetical protein
MRKSLLPIGGALLALAAFASTADARMMGGGGGMSMSPSMSHGAPMSASTGSPRGFSSDARSFSAGGRTFSAEELTRVKGSNWKKPIDSDNGGDDPQPKPPKTQTGDSGGGSHYGGPYGGWGPGHHPHYGPYGGPYGGNGGNSGDGNVPQRDCRGC